MHTLHFYLMQNNLSLSQATIVPGIFTYVSPFCMISCKTFLLFKQLNRCAVHQLISIHHSWKDFSDHVGWKTAAPAFQNLIAEPANCEWMQNKDCFTCCTSRFRLTALNFRVVPQKVVKSEQKCADFEIDLKDLYISDWPSNGCKINALHFLINALLVQNVL